MNLKVEKAKQIAKDFQENFKLNGFIEEDHIKKAISYFENEWAQGNSKEVLNEVVDIFLPKYLEILEESEMRFEADQLQSTRYSILELLNKLLIVRTQQTNVRLYKLLLNIIEKDNETNAVFAAKILQEFIKQLTDQINDQQVGTNSKIQEYGIEKLHKEYSLKQNGQQIENPKIDELLNVLIDIDKSYPELEKLTEKLYKLLCDKSILFSEIFTNYKDPKFAIYKEIGNTLRKNPKQDKSGQQQSQSQSQNKPGVIEKIVPSEVSLSILSQIPHTFIGVANLDLLPFYKLCKEFQKIKSNQLTPQTPLQEKEDSTSIVPEENSQGAGQAQNGVQRQFDVFSNGLVQSMKILINNITKGFADIKILEVYEELSKAASLDLVNALLKTIQLLFVLIKNTTDIMQRALFRSIPQATLDSIMEIGKIFECSLNFIDRCPEEFYLQRQEAMQKLKNLISHKGAKLKLKFLVNMCNEPKIIGNTQMISIQGKNLLYNNYLEINKNALINSKEFSKQYYQKLKTMNPAPLELNTYFYIINAQIDSLLKNLFDNQLYIIIQEKTLDQIKEILNCYIFTPSDIKLTKDPRDFKHTILTKLIHAIQLKYKEIKRNFRVIKTFIAESDKQANPNIKSSSLSAQNLQQSSSVPAQQQKQQFQQQQQEAIQKPDQQNNSQGTQSLHLNQLPYVNISDYNDLEWNKKRVEFIEKNNVDIDSNLQSLKQLYTFHLEIYSEKESLCLNGIKIKKGIDKLYVRDVKNKIVERLIELQAEIQKHIFKENREEEYTRLMNKNPTQAQQKIPKLQTLNLLREEQRQIFKKILSHGLEVFGTFHDYEHNGKNPDNSSSRKNLLLYFMQNFNAINDKISFKDVFEPNMDLIFKYLLKYSECSETCTKSLIIDPFASQNDKNQQNGMMGVPQQQLENPHFAQILTIYLMHKLNTKIEHIDPFSPFYEYRDKFFTLVQQTIKIPLRSFLRLQDYDFVSTHFRIIILFLIKKAHNSTYPLEYLYILRTLFRSVFQQNKEFPIVTTLMNQLFTICNKQEDGQQSQFQNNPSTSSSQELQFQNINILENLVALFDTDIYEAKVIICELINMLPLRVKHQITKTKLLGRPLVKSLSLLDHNNSYRTLITIENIFGYSTSEEIQVFFSEVKDELIDKLYEILYEQRLVEEFRRRTYPCNENQFEKKIQNDPATLVVKLLGRMNHLTRTSKVEERVNQELKGIQYVEQFAIQVDMGNTPNSKSLSLPLNDMILHAIDIFNKLIDNFYCQTARASATQSAYCLLKTSLFQFFPNQLFQNNQQQSLAAKNQEIAASKLFENAYSETEGKITEKENLLEKIMRVFFEIVGIDQKLTTNYSIINQFKKESQSILEVLNETICTLYKEGAPQSFQYLKYFTLSGIRSVKMKLILTREELHQNKEYVCGQIEYIQKLFKQQQIHLKQIEPQKLLEFQEFYLISILHELLNTQNQNKIYGLQVILLDFLEEYATDETLLTRQQSNLIEVVQSVFVVVNQLPDIIKLKTTQVSSQILFKILQFLRKNKESFDKLSIKKLFQIFFNNLLSYRELAYTLSKDCLIKTAQILKCNFIDLFYWKIDTSEFEKAPEIENNFGSNQQMSIPASSHPHFQNTQYPSMSKIIESHSNTFLGSLLSKIKTAIQNFSLANGGFDNLKQVKYLSNAYKSLEFLLCIEPTIPFRVLINDVKNIQEGQQQFDEKNFKFDGDILNIIQSSNIIISTNTEKMSKFVKIIIENPKPPQRNAMPPQQQQPLQPAASQPPQTQQAMQQRSQRPPLADITAQSGAAAAPARAPNSLAQPPRQQIPSQSSSSVQSSSTPNHNFTPNPPAQTQSIPNLFQINNQVYLNIKEFDLNIEDIDLKMKEQSILISSILSFLKSLLLLPVVKKVAKINLDKREKSHQDSSDILSYRYQIILKLFNQMTRIERGISDTAQNCLQEMLDQESNPKELLNNEEKLKSILKPILMCLSNSFSSFTPSFLQVLKKVLKLLTPCFNRQLIEKLTNHLEDVTKDSSSKHNVQCIAGLLKLFQYLQYAYQTAHSLDQMKNKEYIKNSIEGIIKNIHRIETIYSQTEGKYQIQQITRKQLCKFMNSMSYNFSENYFIENDQSIINLLLEVLKLNKSLNVRERLTRFSNLSVVQRLYNKGEKEYKITYLRIIKNLATKNHRLMLSNQQGIECIKERFIESTKVQQDKTIAENPQVQLTQVPKKNETVYYLKILILYCQQKQTDIDTIFSLANFMSFRLPRYTMFLQDFFHYYLPYHYAPDKKKAIFDKFIELILENLDKKEKIEKIINISYHVIYPMLVHSNKLDQISQIVDLEKYLSLLSKFSVPKQKFPFYRIEIELLQISTLLLPYMQTEGRQLKKQFIQYGWKYMKVEDKMLKHFGFLYTSQFIRIHSFPDDMITNIYLSLVKFQNDNCQNQDLEIWALTKKALNYLIQHIASDNQNQNVKNEWLNYTIGIFQDEQNSKQSNGIRFLNLFIKNHKIFQKYRNQFTSPMANYMQFLIIPPSAHKNTTSVANNKMAWDLAFLFIEWSFIKLKELLLNAEKNAKKKKIIELQLASQLNEANTPSFKIEEENSLKGQESSVMEEEIKESKRMLSQDQRINSRGEQDEENIFLTEEEILREKVEIIEQFSNENDLRVKQIVIPFFMKLIQNILQIERDREETQFIKNSLYLFKKISFLWPDSVMKHDYYKKELSKFSNKGKYYSYCQLSILSIILEFESNEKILNFLPIVYKILENKPQQGPNINGQPGSTPNGNLSQPLPNMGSMNNTQQMSAEQNLLLQNQQSQSMQGGIQHLLLQNEVYAIILSVIFKRLLNVATLYKDNEQAQEFTRNVHTLVRESLEQYVKGKANSQMMQSQSQIANQQNQANLALMKQSLPMSITLAIKVMRIIYSLDDKVDLGLRNIKNLLSYQLESVKRMKSPYDGYFLLDKYPEISNSVCTKIIKTKISQTQNKEYQSEFSEEYLESLMYNEEVFDTPKIQMIHSKQNFISLMRILALKINSFNDRENQDITIIIKLFASNLEKMADLDIRIESINLLKCLLIGEQAFPGGVLPPQYSKIKHLTLSSEKKMEKILLIMNYIATIFDKKFGQAYQQVKLTSTNSDYSAECMSLKLAEESIAKEFMSFLIKTIHDSGINKLDSDFIRYLLLLFSKNSSSKDLALFLQLAGDLFCTNEFNCLQMILGQFQTEQCLNKISKVTNSNVKDINLENLEQNEVLLLGFKVILFRIVDCAYKVSIKLTSKQFLDNEIGDYGERSQDVLDPLVLEKHKKFFEMRNYTLSKRDIIEIYGEMMTSGQLKQSPVSYPPQTVEQSTPQFILYQHQVAFNCPITPHLLIPAFKKVFNFMVELSPKPIQLRQQAMVLFEQTFLRINYFPTYVPQPQNSTLKQYISLYLGQALIELMLEELSNPTGYIIHVEKLQTSCREYFVWSQMQLFLEKLHFERNKYISQHQISPLQNFETSSTLEQLLYLLDELNETDLSYGLKYYLATSPQLQRAIAIQQQREWVDAQNYLIENSQAIFNDQLSQLDYVEYPQIMDHTIYKTLLIETQKNLNKWEELLDYSEKYFHINLNLECMLNTSNIVGMKKQFKKCSENGIFQENSFRYHCQSLIEFQCSPTDEQKDSSQNLTFAFYNTMKEWTKFPRNYAAVHLKHSNQLQLLIELEDAYRVRDPKDQQSQHPVMMIEQFAKNSQLLINQWREKMPSKFENLTTWKNIIEQRNVIFTSIHNKLKDKFRSFLTKIQQTAAQQRKANSNNPNSNSNSNNNATPEPSANSNNNSTSTNAPANAGQPGAPSTAASTSQGQNQQSQSSQQSSQSQNVEQYATSYLENEKIERILAPFTDSRWNILKYLRIQRLFGNYTIDKMPNQDNKLHPEEVYLRAKLISSIYRENESFNNLKSAIETIEKSCSKDQEEFKYHKADLYRKRALLCWQNKKYLECTEDMQKSIQTCESYFKTWHSWLGICFSSYLKRNNSEYWARNAMQLIPQALKYKSYKSQLIFSYALFINSTDSQFFVENIKQIAPELPKPQLLLWIPFMISSIQNSTIPDVVDIFNKLLSELSQQYPQHVFYYLRGQLDFSNNNNSSNNAQQQSSSNNANTNGNTNNPQILQIYNNLKTGPNSALIKKLEIFADTLAKQYMQLPSSFSFEQSLFDVNCLLEDISSIRLNKDIDNTNSMNNIWQKTQSVLERLLTFPFISKEIITAQEVSSFLSLNNNSSSNNNSIQLNEILQFIRYKVYQPLLQMYIRNYTTDNSNNNNKHISNYIQSDQLLLLSQNSQEIELPGQYKINYNSVVFRDFDPSQHLVVQQINKQLLLGLKNRQVHRQIQIQANNNKQYQYEICDFGMDSSSNNNSANRKNMIQYQQNQIRIQLVQQMQDIMNILFNLNKETNIRQLQIKNNMKYPLLIKSDYKYTSTYRGQLQLMLSPSTPLELTMQDILDQHLQSQQQQSNSSNSNNKNVIDQFNCSLDDFNGYNQIQINQSMKRKVPDTILSDFVMYHCSNTQEYIQIRKESAYSFSCAMFFNYFLGNTVTLYDISLDYSRGLIKSNSTNIQLTSDYQKILTKNIHSIRLSQNITHYLGEISLLGIVSPSFISMAKAITNPKYPMKEICSLFLNEILICNGLPKSNPVDEFEVTLKLYEKLLWLYVENIDKNWNTKQNSSEKQFESAHSEANTQSEQGIGQAQSRTNNGYAEPIYPRVYDIIDTMRQNQQHNANSLHLKYWF